MSNFEVFHFPEENYEYVILFTINEELYFLTDEIYSSLLQNNHHSFFVLVDLFLRNGYSFNRYCLMQFDGNGQYKTTVVNPREVSDNIKKTIRSYLVNNPAILKESALSEKTISFIKTTYI